MAHPSRPYDPNEPTDWYLARGQFPPWWDAATIAQWQSRQAAAREYTTAVEETDPPDYTDLDPDLSAGDGG